MQSAAVSAPPDWFGFRRVVTHVAAFAGGVVASLAVDLPAALLVAKALAPTAAVRTEFVRLVTTASVCLVFSGALAAGHVAARLLAILDERRHSLGDRFAHSAAAGFVHGLFGVWPVMLLVHWIDSRHGQPRPLVFAGGTVLALAWYAAWCFASGILVERLVRITRPDTDPCTRCGYDLTANTSRACPECGLPY